MTNVAVIADGKVANIARFENDDDVKDFPFEDANGAGAFGVILHEGQSVDINWLYEGGEFFAPPLTEEEQAETEAAAVAASESRKSLLMDEASQKISVLQDAVSLDMATDEEAAALPLWQKYRVLLNRLDMSAAPDITWPDKPDV